MSPSRHQSIQRGKWLQRQNVISSLIQKVERVQRQNARRSSINTNQCNVNMATLPSEFTAHITWAHDWLKPRQRQKSWNFMSKLVSFRQTLYSRTEPYAKGREQTLKSVHYPWLSRRTGRPVRIDANNSTLMVHELSQNVRNQSTLDTGNHRNQLLSTGSTQLQHSRKDTPRYDTTHSHWGFDGRIT